MTVYYLKTKARSSAHNVVFKAGKAFDRIEEFFVAGDDPPGTRFLPPLVGELQYGVKASVLPTLDYLPSFGGLPLFSPTFVRALGEELRHDIDFHPCTVQCEQEPFAFFAARLLRKVHLLDYRASGLAPETARSRSNFLRGDLHADFLVARERHPLKCYVFVASGAFKEAVEHHRLKIGFERAAVFDPTS